MRNQFERTLGDAVMMTAGDMTDSTLGVENRDGLPVAWRLFRFGANHVSKFDGTEFDIEMTEEIADAVVENYRRKGAKVPLDSKHFLYVLAQRHGVNEDEVSTMLGGRATFGFGELEKREDGLWVANVEYVPLAKKLIAEKTFRYFSPVLRGFATGAWRITSVTFTNGPAMDGLDAIAAEAAIFDRKFSNSNDQTLQQQREDQMKALAPMVAALLGMDSIALDADGNVNENVLNGLKKAKERLDAGNDFLKSMGDSLGLDAETDYKTVKGAVLGLQERAKTADELKGRVDALALDAETRKRDELIAKGKASGQLTKDLVENWVDDKNDPLDSKALEAFLKTAPRIVPTTPVDRSNLAEGDAVALTAEQSAILSSLGITGEEDQKKAVAAE